MSTAISVNGECVCVHVYVEGEHAPGVLHMVQSFCLPQAVMLSSRQQGGMWHRVRR